MSGPVSNFVTQLLSWNDRTINNPLIGRQSQPWIGTPYAVAETLACTITAVAATIFALFAGSLGFICKGIGLKEVGQDLLASADIALLGPNDDIMGAIELYVVAGFSLVNAVSFTLFTQCMKAQHAARAAPAC